ncbi:TetR/AcrR family transcriptional regulator [Streptomyces fragilis]|uniref:TetR/AcrR family transcriptional regulator n=1 Tax=Streptomyces fragilis TaxID=67301 RepID=UPI0027E34B7E|nr:TetR-like C-terminal domain-containing protein [Streptomyces fragilis]
MGLREIARRAGVSHGAPRRHFPTHHALLSAIARRGFEDLGARFVAAAADVPTPRGRLEAVARTYVGYALERRGMFELMFRHELLDSTSQRAEGGQPRLREATLPMFRHFTRMVAGCRPGREAEVTAAALWANLHGVAQLWAWGSLQLALGHEGSADEERDRLVMAVLDAHLGPVTP